MDLLSLYKERAHRFLALVKLPLVFEGKGEWKSRTAAAVDLIIY